MISVKPLELKKFYTMGEATKATGITPGQFYYGIKHGYLPTEIKKKYGNMGPERQMVLGSDLASYIENFILVNEAKNENKTKR